MQSLEMRRLHNHTQPFVDLNATVHQPQLVPPSLQLQPSAPTPTQAAVYESFHVSARRPGGSIDLRFRHWLEELDSWLSINPQVTYLSMKDHPTQKSILDEITSIQEDVQDPSHVEKMAATLFKCAACTPLRRSTRQTHVGHACTSWPTRALGPQRAATPACALTHRSRAGTCGARRRHGTVSRSWWLSSTSCWGASAS
jgi:hypothetical protein